MLIFKSYGLRTIFRSYSFIVSIILALSFCFFPLVTYADSIDNATESCFITTNITHKHTGDSTHGGGCYGKLVTGSKKEEAPCGGTLIYNSGTDTSGCDKCGAGYSGNRGGESCPKSEIIDVSYSYYEKNCKQNTTDILGTVTLTKSTTEWTRFLDLSCSFENSAGFLLKEQPFIWNGTVSDKGTLSVSENETYKVALNIKEKPENYTASVSMKVDNIDCTPPTVIEYSLTPDNWTKNGVTFHIVRVSDLQPDKSEGAGLSEFPYSYDNGNTWCEEDTYLYAKNGTYTVLIRDTVGNTSNLNLIITCIDTVGPDITAIDYDHTQGIKETTLSVSANDVMEDGSVGVGLHDIPYSFDNEKTWTADNSILLESNKSINVSVRDKLDNITRKNVNISNIYEPIPTATEEPTESEVEVTQNPVNVPKVNKVETYNKEKIGVNEKKSSRNENNKLKSEVKQPISKQPEKIVKEQKTPQVASINKTKWDMNEIIFLLSILLVLLSGLIILVRLWYHSILVYNEVENGNYERIGRQWMRKKEEHYEVVIPSLVYSQCSTTHFLFRPSALFLIHHKNDTIVFLFPEELCVNLKAEKEMEIKAWKS